MESEKTAEMKEVLELLEKAKVLCEVNKEKDDGLNKVKEILDVVTDGDTDYLLEQYHNSNCY